MSNSREWTRTFNTTTRKLEGFVKAKAGRSSKARREAMERAATMPNSLPPIARSGAIPGGTRSSIMQGEGR